MLTKYISSGFSINQRIRSSTNEQIQKFNNQMSNKMLKHTINKNPKHPKGRSRSIDNGPHEENKPC